MSITCVSLLVVKLFLLLWVFQTISRSDTISWTLLVYFKTRNSCFCHKFLNFRYLRKFPTLPSKLPLFDKEFTKEKYANKCVIKYVIYILKKPVTRCDPILKVYQYVKENGFTLQIHPVQTYDGYILNVHRIVKSNGEAEEKTSRKPYKGVIYLQHGLMCCSADWMVPGGIAYVLAGHGYDVWMGNFRGNIFSLKHTHLSHKTNDFWQFSWDQHGIVDLPAMIHYVMKSTKVSTIRYIGHSMGTTSLFVMLNEFPEMNNIIDYCVAMAPVAHIPNMTGLQKKYLNHVYLGLKVIKAIRLYNLTFYKAYFVPKILEFLALFVNGFHSASDERFDQISDFAPAGTSIFTVTQYIKNHKVKDFMTRDCDNIYSLSEVKVPITSWFSDADWASCEADARAIDMQLGSLIREVKQVPLENYGHLDFLWDVRSAEGLYRLIAEDIGRYDKSLDAEM